MLPPEYRVFPPPSGFFSTSKTSAPASVAANAPADPAPPNPTTTISVSRSHIRLFTQVERTLFQSENFHEFFVVARVILGQTDIADVELDPFSLEFIGLDPLAGRTSAEASKNFLPFFGE